MFPHRQGRLLDYDLKLLVASDGSGYDCSLNRVGRKVDVDELMDANAAADLLGLAHRNTVSVYQHRYDDMPRPVLDLGNGRVKLWLRSELERWAAQLAAEGRIRRRPSRS